MSGQDTINLPLADSLRVGKDTLCTQVFEMSMTVPEIGPLKGGMEGAHTVMVFHPAWLFMYLFVLLGFFAWIKLYYGNILIQTVQASTNFQIASKMFKANSQLQKQLDNILYAFYFLSIAFLLFIVEVGLDLAPYEFKGGILFLFNFILLIGIFLGRVVLLNLVGLLFNQLKIFREYLYNVFIFNKLIGMVILPLLLFVVYTTGILQMVMFWVTLSIASGVIILKLIRGVVFSFKKDISIFYMFLYLCALEIAPLVLLYKWLEGIL